ncbi:MAG TPA: hypothetical protein VLY23_02690 [Candidatus Acidoferrum sp.]|nr:hypothetical protein [Candidatus Acidoferrum sp.]
MSNATNIVPAREAIDELKAMAAECERKAEGEPEPAATKLKDEAKLYRGWAAALQSGKWKS